MVRERDTKSRGLRECHWLRGQWLPLFFLLFWTGMAAATPDALTWTTNYYTVRGSSVREIQQSIRQARPWKDRLNAEGFTEWRVDWRYAVTPSSDGCRCTSFTTRTTITVTLPQWIAPTNASPETRAAWSRYLSALGRHEAGHAANARAAVAEQHQRIKALGAVGDCEALKRQIDNVARQVIDEYRRRDAEYDQRTAHGLNEGAVLGRPPGERRGPRE